VSVRIAPSILAADFARLGDEIARVEEAGADWIHVDVMDGHFVPNLTIGPPVVAAIRKVTSLPLDVHLMITNPDRYLKAFAEAGVSGLSVHAEVCADLAATLDGIRRLDVKAAAALNPGTPLSALGDAVDQLDYLLVMSVEPGFSGQRFIPSSIEKVREARHLLAHRKPEADIEVDGGVGPDNAAKLVHAGATILVAGAAVFHAPDCLAAVRGLRAAAAA